MASDVISDIEYETDLTDIDEDAIPVLSEAVELDDYLEESERPTSVEATGYSESGEILSAFMDEMPAGEVAERESADDPIPLLADAMQPEPMFGAFERVCDTPEPVGEISEPICDTCEPVEATAEFVEATVEFVEDTSEPVEATAEFVEDTSEPVETTSEPVEATSEPVDDTLAPSPQIITAAHASVALLNNPAHSTIVETALRDDDSIEIDAALFAHADAIQSPVKISQNVVTPSLQTQKKENPFLPQHILDRLQGSGRNLVEEIARSSATLEACTALLRTRAATDRLLSSATRLAAEDQSLVRKQKLVDELVDDYLPLIAAELRRRLHRMLDE